MALRTPCCVLFSDNSALCQYKPALHTDGEPRGRKEASTESIDKVATRKETINNNIGLFGWPAMCLSELSSFALGEMVFPGNVVDGKVRLEKTCRGRS